MNTYYAPIAQLDRVSDYESEGCRFDSYWVHFLLQSFLFREVAQFGRAPGLGPGGRRFESCLPDFLQRGLYDILILLSKQYLIIGK